MPVRNSETTVRSAIESILNQTYVHWELIISDNDSDDGTQKICEEIALLDSRVKYFRQDLNIGAAKNFAFVLKKSKGNYFMWASGDDSRSPNFIEANLMELLTNDLFVASTSPNIFEGNSLNNVTKVEFALTGGRVSRIRNFFESANESHGIFYSLMRRNAIADCPFLEETFFAWDWAVDIYLLNQGEIHRSRNGLITLGTGGLSLSSKRFQAFGLMGLKRVFPLSKFNLKVYNIVKNYGFREKWQIYFSLITLNKGLLMWELKNLLRFLKRKFHN